MRPRNHSVLLSMNLSSAMMMPVRKVSLQWLNEFWETWVWCHRALFCWNYPNLLKYMQSWMGSNRQKAAQPLVKPWHLNTFHTIVKPPNTFKIFLVKTSVRGWFESAQYLIYTIRKTKQVQLWLIGLICILPVFQVPDSDVMISVVLILIGACLW